MASKLSLIAFSLLIVHSCAEHSVENNTASTTQTEGCGRHNPEGIGFKMGHNVKGEAEFGEFPWMVAIFNSENDGDVINYRYRCGGSLIAPNVVLTVAHCVKFDQAEELLARGGDWNLQNTDEIVSHVDINVKKIISHEKHNSRTFLNDVALLILNEPFVWQDHISTICLPEETVNFDSTRCYVTGWGKDKFDANSTSILKKIEVPIVPDDTCQQIWRRSVYAKKFNWHESFLCAGGEKDKDKDNCTPYSGSPLVCPIPGQKDRYYQAGILSWGERCGGENIPDVYTNVTNLRSWINAKLTENNIEYRHLTP